MSDFRDLPHNRRRFRPEDFITAEPRPLGNADDDDDGAYAAESAASIATRGSSIAAKAAGDSWSYFIRTRAGVCITFGSLEVNGPWLELHSVERLHIPGAETDWCEHACLTRRIEVLAADVELFAEAES